MENFQKFSEKTVSAKQLKAINMLIYEDLSKGEIAKALKITPQTLSNWLNPKKTPHFIEAFEKELAVADRLRKNNYRVVAQKAQDKLIELLECNDKNVAFRACKDLLDRAGDKPEDNAFIRDTQTEDDEPDTSFFDALNGKAAEVWNEEAKKD